MSVVAVLRHRSLWVVDRFIFLAAFAIPSSIPSSAVSVDPSLLSVSIEFFAFPGYMSLPQTKTCLANLQSLRGSPPAVRIGGTTQYVLKLLFTLY